MLCSTKFYTSAEVKICFMNNFCLTSPSSSKLKSSNIIRKFPLIKNHKFSVFGTTNKFKHSMNFQEFSSLSQWCSIKRSRLAIYNLCLFCQAMSFNPSKGDNTRWIRKVNVKNIWWLTLHVSCLCEHETREISSLSEVNGSPSTYSRFNGLHL